MSVFLADPDRQGERDIRRAWSLLDDEERARAHDLRAPRDQQTFVVAHGLLRTVLARATGQDARSIRFARTRHGRPELAGNAGPASTLSRFNLSHTQGLVGCAVVAAGDVDVGLDLEEVRTPAPLDVAHRYFSSEELAGLRALPPAGQSDRFYALWTLKEAYLKGRGIGHHLRLDSFTVYPAPGGRARLAGPEPGEDGRAWTLRWWRYARHAVALAVRAPAARVRVTMSAEMKIGDSD